MIEIPVLGEITPEEFEIIKQANQIELREKQRVFGANLEAMQAIQMRRINLEMIAARTVKVAQ